MEELEKLANFEQFQRIRLILGDEKFFKLMNSSVTIIGLGAVGGYVTEALSRSGIMKLNIIDHDVVSESNINRQIFALHSTVGIKKTEVALSRIKDINPYAEVNAYDLFINKDTVHKVFETKPDIVIDAIDSLNPKFEVLKMAYDLDYPIISSMGAALKQDGFKVKQAYLKDTKNCPLAKMLRKRFAKFKIKPKIPCIYSDEVLDKENMAIIEPETNDQLASGRVRNIMGSLPTITGIFGLQIANYVINYLTSR
ncbi:MAG: tRNA threonylcarbamoyladenosine dehydratase [Alphaproteobacteria bacterium ADurb.Bin438]|nr:MAG: tRNA threonylcarbamoyladenosine dehydratase [Alphaproteobacteria bacterium ADurb.Bin438]